MTKILNKTVDQVAHAMLDKYYVFEREGALKRLEDYCKEHRHNFSLVLQWIALRWVATQEKRIERAKNSGKNGRPPYIAPSEDYINLSREEFLLKHNISKSTYYKYRAKILKENKNV